MNIKEMIAAKRVDLAELVARRDAQTAAIEEVRKAVDSQARTATADEADLVRKAQTDRAGLDARIKSLTEEVEALEHDLAADEAAAKLDREVDVQGRDAVKYDEVVRVKAEPRTYTPEGSLSGRSFFVDAYRSEHGSDFKARERLERHMREVEVEGEMSSRSQTSGGAAGLVIPQYLVDEAALIARAGRPVANAVRRLPLPAEGMSIIIPRSTTGVTAASQATENTAVSNTDQVWANVTAPVVTIAGQQGVSRQLLERGSAGVDQLIYTDLAAAYATELDRQVINGSGSSNQMLGMLNTSGINTATAFGAAPTAALFTLKLAGQKAAVAGNRNLQANLVICAPRRWGWLEGLVDSTNRPIVAALAGAPTNALGVYDEASGKVLGLPVVVDGNVPTAVGTNNEDVVIVTRAEDNILWEEGDGMPRELRFEETGGGNLTTQLVAYGYAAFTAGRYPSAVGRVGGVDTGGSGANGLVAPSF